MHNVKEKHKLSLYSDVAMLHFPLFLWKWPFTAVREVCNGSSIIIIITIIIINMESAVQGRERVRRLYQSKDPNPTQPTHGRKKKIKQ